MLGEKIEKHDAKVWLVNTGWTGGAYGQGHRMHLSHTRRMVAAALSGELDETETFEQPVFGLKVPKHVAGVPDEVLNPRETWEDKEAYDEQTAKLAKMFGRNFEQFADDVSEEIRAAGPNLEAAKKA